MAVFSFPPEPAKKQLSKRKNKQRPSSSSWDQIKNLLTCKQIQDSKIHDPSKNNSATLLGSSCSSICPSGDVVHGNTRVCHRSDNSLGQETRLLSKKSSNWSSSSSSSSTSISSSVRSSSGGGGGSTYTAGSSKGMHFSKLSGCYECHAIVDHTRYPFPRTIICACSECGEVFPKIDSLEHHQAINHAVSEMGQDDSSRNIVEIIFKSSWLKKDSAICNIERILKVHNTQLTIQQFEEYRDAVKICATSNAKKNPRCAADGNELLRFHCATLVCSLGACGSTSLCGSFPSCGVCTIIRHGFQENKVSGVHTTASSGRAHDCLDNGDVQRAMLVCRVIAGRVKQVAHSATFEEDGVGMSHAHSYDSLAECAGIFSKLEELYVFNPRAILPCFVVIYKALES
ncbi:Zinc finger, C2H2 domain containing [Olea europaea subsp. europaea]|uniref:Zinc finger, C2H2 domain containing n=2 Tax=Olea europaea subsp. europaea TaxID=158383 RepID=A0A8S0PIY3_OLEEU|nr:Zinc finger, C2H2 domain containing [Olea europaea subsp. europaea]